jgi:hypothetical protein
VSFRTLGTFTKDSATSVIEVTWNSDVVKVTGGDYCTWHVRVDDNQSINPDSGGAQTGRLGATTTDAFVTPASTTDVFSGLALGSHSLSLWLTATTAAQCQENTGNGSVAVPKDNTRWVIITEYNP